MSHQIEEEQKTQLLTNNNDADNSNMNFANSEMNVDDGEIRPSSSRVKKVLMWNAETRHFEMSQEDMDELQNVHINNPAHWSDFKRMYTNLDPFDHPSIKKSSKCKALLFYSLAFILLLILAYCFFIILQLALFNLIMLVVMAVFWCKMYKFSKNIISMKLDKGRKTAFKQWIKRLKDLEWLKEKSIEIQENDDGKWIEIHLNETTDEVGDGSIHEEDNEDD